MLQEVKDLQNQAVAELVECVAKNDELTFKAPTGSGKTFIMARFMDIQSLRIVRKFNIQEMR